jgi:hypothetical protein
MLRNVVALGFKDLGVVLSQESTCTELFADRLSVGSSLFWDNGADATSNVSNITTVGAAACDVKAWLVGKGNQEKDPQLRTPYDLTQPDFRPTAASPALSGSATPPAGDTFFAPANYLGAFGPDDATNWIAGWTAFPQN